jgi:hypothetical protein
MPACFADGRFDLHYCACIGSSHHVMHERASREGQLLPLSDVHREISKVFVSKDFVEIFHVY